MGFKNFMEWWKLWSRRTVAQCGGKRFEVA